jgi:hypothetical protein
LKRGLPLNVSCHVVLLISFRPFLSLPNCITVYLRRLSY